MNENVEGGIRIHDGTGRVIASEWDPATRVGTPNGAFVGIAEVTIKPADHRAERIEELEAEVARLRKERTSAE